MNTLPKELENIIQDYNYQLEQTERMNIVFKELIKRVEKLDKLRFYEYQYYTENDICNCLDICNSFEDEEGLTDSILIDDVDCYRIYEGQWNKSWIERRNIHIDC